MNKSATVNVKENPLVKYFKDTRAELRKVTWPTRDEAWRLTAVVLGVTAAFAVFLWGMDALFSNAIQLIIQQILGI